MKEVKAEELDSKFDQGNSIIGDLTLTSSRRVNRPSFISPNTSGVKVVLFDCDGVICPPMRFADLLEREHRITREMTAEFFKSTFLPSLLGKIDVLELLPPYLAKWGWRHSPETFLNLWLSSEREVRQDVIDMIGELRQTGYVVGLATNQESRRAKYLRGDMGFESIFDYCFISSELGYMKPQLDFFKAVAKRVDATPQRIIFIDDQQNYLDAASECGLQTILFNDAEVTRKQLSAMLESANQSRLEEDSK